MTKDELVASLSQGAANHAEVLEAGREAAQDMVALVNQVIADYSEV
jgi:purine-nucleoside phosphorylase